MTIAESHVYFDLLADNIGSPKFTPAQKDVFITQACIEYVKELFPSNEGGVVNVDVDQTTYSNIYSLVYNLSVSYSDTKTIASIQTALNTASSSTEAWMYILGVSLTVSGSTYPVKYVKQNNWFANEDNYFKQGSTAHKQYNFRFDSQNFRFSPAQSVSGTPLSFVVVKQPKAVSITTPTNIELPAHTHKAVVEKAVQLSATGTRDIELAQLNG